MNLTIDNDAQILRLTEAGASREIPLYSPEAFERISREWVRLGWALHTYYTFSWFGRPILQLPEDLVRLQEVVYRLKPDVIIETGICDGGSLLFHASLFEAIGKGRVIGVDIQVREGTRTSFGSHPLAHRIAMIEGDSIASSTVEQVRAMIQPGETVMAILDSDHTRAHVLGELEAYAPLITTGSCIVAADGIMRDLADVPGGDMSWIHDNPASAAHDFAAKHPEFEMRQPEWISSVSPLRSNVTYWPDGWLWRKA